MLTDIPKIDENLLPDRYPQQELFICDVASAVLKDIMQHMEHPFYSLSKKPDTAIRRYEHNGKFIEISPSIKGLATIYDKDILIYCISQIMDKLKKGEKVSQRVKISSYNLLVFTNRGIGGKDYKALSEAIDRLAGTRIKTNVRAGEIETEDHFGLIDAASIKRTHGIDGRLLSCEIKLSDWVFNAIKAQEVLTLHPNYFRLRKPLERRVYEVARKHCGQNHTWSISLEKLHKKTGSRSPMKRFRQLMKDLAQTNHLPDYDVFLEDGKAIFTNRNTMPKQSEERGKTSGQPSLFDTLPQLKKNTLRIAQKHAPTYDINRLQAEWIEHWRNTGNKQLKNPDAAFIGFCKQKTALI